MKLTDDIGFYKTPSGGSLTICPSCEQLTKREEVVNGECPTCKKGREGKTSDHKTTHQQGYFDDGGQLIATTEDNKSIVQKVCEETGISEETAIDVLYIIDKSLDSQRSEFQIIENVKEKCNQWRALIERTLLQVQQYETNGGSRVVAERCAWLLLNFPLLAGASTQDGLVSMFRQTLDGAQPKKQEGIEWLKFLKLRKLYSKQTINACIQFLQKQVPELPPLPGQRTNESCQQMANARKNQIQKP